MTPPIPTQLAHRPTLGGLVVPYISLRTDRGWHLGHISQPRWREVIEGWRCQVCGRWLGVDGRFVLHVRPSDIAVGYSAEPAQHPVCAAYSAAACPMVAGRRDRYRAPADLTARTCELPDCRCHLVPDNPAQRELRAGADAEPWLALWCAPDQYARAHNPAGDLLGLAIPKEPRRIRPVSGPDVDALALLRGAT
ncbi:hypothetical protein [Nocardiopsis dassonvillei]|uniref:hypothetical protein n=1 Tax=Nocardiopsis dassonvillei TaxID=2014 RepID=UPI00363D6840